MSFIVLVYTMNLRKINYFLLIKLLYSPFKRNKKSFILKNIYFSKLYKNS